MYFKLKKLVYSVFWWAKFLMKYPSVYGVGKTVEAQYFILSETFEQSLVKLAI